eukprot:scaffold2423_cov113-Isochrysis_galbana.AAC.3
MDAHEAPGSQPRTAAVACRVCAGVRARYVDGGRFPVSPRRNANDERATSGREARATALRNRRRCCAPLRRHAAPQRVVFTRGRQRKGHHKGVAAGLTQRGRQAHQRAAFLPQRRARHKLRQPQLRPARLPVTCSRGSRGGERRAHGSEKHGTPKSGERLDTSARAAPKGVGRLAIPNPVGARLVDARAHRGHVQHLARARWVGHAHDTVGLFALVCVGERRVRRASEELEHNFERVVLRARLLRVEAKRVAGAHAAVRMRLTGRGRHLISPVGASLRIPVGAPAEWRDGALRIASVAEMVVLMQPSTEELATARGARGGAVR